MRYQESIPAMTGAAMPDMKARLAFIMRNATKTVAWNIRHKVFAMLYHTTTMKMEKQNAG